MRDQRKTLLVALGLAVAAYWIIGQLGEWRLAACLSLGVALGLVNHLATEYWLLRIISSGEQPCRGQMIRATIVRLVGPDRRRGRASPSGCGRTAIGLLLGLAIFRLLALMMTSVTLLKELKSE